MYIVFNQNAPPDLLTPVAFIFRATIHITINHAAILEKLSSCFMPCRAFYLS